MDVALSLGAFSAVLLSPVLAQTVKVTPLGGIEGEFCPQDPALIFEDPNGTRVLYDAGRTIAGADDLRLGRIDIILVSPMHCKSVDPDCIGGAPGKAMKDTGLVVLLI